MDGYFSFDAGDVVLQSGMTFRGAKLFTMTDNVRIQHRLLTEQLGIRS